MKITYDHDKDYVRFSRIAREMKREFDAFHVSHVQVGVPLHKAKPKGRHPKFPCGCTMERICKKHVAMRTEGNRQETNPTMAAYLTEGLDVNGHRVIIAVDTHPGPAVYHFLAAMRDAQSGFGSWSKLVSIRVQPFLLNHFYGLEHVSYNSTCSALRSKEDPTGMLQGAPFLSDVEVIGLNEETRKRKAAKA